MVAAIFEAELDSGQAADLARLMDEGRPTRPEGVVTATLLYDAAELMRNVGAEPTMTIVDVLEHR